MPAVLAVLLVAALAAAAPAAAQVRSPGAPQVSTYTTGLEHPWELAFLPEGGALVTERAGRVRLLRADGGLVPEPALSTPVGGGEGGTLGLALDPGYAANRLVYLYRTTPAPENQVVRYRFDGARLIEEAVVIGAIPAGTIHNGGRLRFGPDGALYVTTGDAGDAGLAQQPGSLAGKVLRLPLAGARGAGEGLEVFTLGHRNPQGLDFQPGTGELYADEHGPAGQDEVNRLVRGENYGWPNATGPDHPAPFRSPLATYSTIAPSGATFVRQGGSAWSGDYLIGALRGQQIRRLRFDGDRVLVNEALFEGAFGRLRDVVEGPDGALYALTGNGDDRILRIVPPAAGVAPPAPGAPAGGALARETRVTEVDTFGGLTAWSAFQPATGTYRLMLREEGALGVPAGVGPRAVPFDVDLGPGPGGGVVAVYSRCAREPQRHDAAGVLLRATGRGCDVFRYDVATGQESKLAGASTDQASEFLPSVWRDEVAFARVYERRAGRRGDLPYLYVRPLAGGRSERQPGGDRGDTGLPGPTSLDLYGRRLGFTWNWADGDRLRSELRLDTVGGGHRLLERLGSRTRPATILTLSLSRGRIYAGERRVRGRFSADRLVRRRFDGRDRAVAMLSLDAMLVAVAVDGSDTFIATAQDATAAPACRRDGDPDPSPGCAVTQIATPGYR